MYLVAEELHASGGSGSSLWWFVAFQQASFCLATYQFRTLKCLEQFGFCWMVLFAMIGLDLPQIVSGLETDLSGCIRLWCFDYIYSDDNHDRWAYGAVFITTMIMRTSSLLLTDKIQGWKAPALTVGRLRGGFTGCTFIPLTLQDGTPFPHRNLIFYLSLSLSFCSLWWFRVWRCLLSHQKILGSWLPRAEKEIDYENPKRTQKNREEENRYPFWKLENSPRYRIGFANLGNREQFGSYSEFSGNNRNLPGYHKPAAKEWLISKTVRGNSSWMKKLYVNI